MSGWSFNRANYYRAESLLGEWENMGDPCVNDTLGTTFNSQTSYVFSPDGGESFIHVSERHNTKSFLHRSYIMLPIEFDGEWKLRIEYREETEL